jgi:hypothetical protein
MKKPLIRIARTIGLTFITGLSLTSCYEGTYVRHYNHHSRGWYGRRHVEPPAGINFEVEEHRHR